MDLPSQHREINGPVQALQLDLLGHADAKGLVHAQEEQPRRREGPQEDDEPPDELHAVCV